MKKSSPIWNSIGILAGAVILVLALAHGTPRTVLLSVAATFWMLWLALALLGRAGQTKPFRHRRHKHPKRAAFDYDAPTAEQLLLCHVNHRISARLLAAHPDATWEWCVKDPVQLIRKGGTGRIRVFGIPDYDYADIRIDQHANLGCNLIRVMSLDGQDGNEGEKLPPNKQPVDPRIWYEEQGRELLERLVADLNSRGHSRLTLTEDGGICIHEDAEEVSVGRFASFPEKVYWPGLVKALEGDGLAADATAQGIQVTW